MKKWNAQFINELVKNMKEEPMELKDGIIFRNDKYWFAPNFDDGITDFDNGIIYRLTAQEMATGIINGLEVGKVINGTAYKY